MAITQPGTEEVEANKTEIPVDKRGQEVVSEQLTDPQIKAVKDEAHEKVGITHILIEWMNKFKLELKEMKQGYPDLQNLLETKYYIHKINPATEETFKEGSFTEEEKEGVPETYKKYTNDQDETIIIDNRELQNAKTTKRAFYQLQNISSRDEKGMTQFEDLFIYKDKIMVTRVTSTHDQKKIKYSQPITIPGDFKEILSSDTIYKLHTENKLADFLQTLIVKSNKTKIGLSNIWDNR
jgi:hypothetical protein